MARTKKSDEKERKIIRQAKEQGAYAQSAAPSKPDEKKSSTKLKKSQAKSYAKGKARDTKAKAAAKAKAAKTKAGKKKIVSADAAKQKAAKTSLDPALKKSIDEAVARALAAKKKHETGVGIGSSARRYQAEKDRIKAQGPLRRSTNPEKKYKYN